MSGKRSHQWIDERSLTLARAIADKLRRQPELVEVARSNLRRWKVNLAPWPRALGEWERILDDGLEAVIARLTAESSQGQRLRQSHPFPGVLTPRERAVIFRQYETRTA